MASDKLSVYKAKRNFSITPEPAEGGAEGVEGLQFVIQKHWASRLHYDFRLELGGTMKSWAVPKGPSYDTADKRMAVRTEDHPIAYNHFEGEIPAKQYGAGKVIIWDEGTWHPIGDPEASLNAGNLKFELRGRKLLGKWALIRIKARDERQEPWLLIKEKDQFVRPASEFSVVDEFPDSVKEFPVPGPQKGARKSAAVTGLPPVPFSPPAAAKANQLAKDNAPHLKAIKAQLPEKLSPQLATLVSGPPVDPEKWVYEIKFDGYRLLARVDGGNVKLFTRNGNDWAERMLALRDAVAKMKLPPGWYDGEIVVLSDAGVPDFGALQNSFDSEKTGDIVYYVFDAPYLNGYDMRLVPLEARREAVRGAILEAPAQAVRFSEVFDAPPDSVVTSACKLGLEGVIAKRRDSAYRSARSSDWIKLKCSHRQEFVIGGWTDPQGARTGIGSLLLGVHDAMGRFVYAGNVGTGFNEKNLVDIRGRLDAIAAKVSPFDTKTGITGRPHWVEPKLIAEVTFGEWTKDARVRHAVFHGLRSDKNPKAIVRENAVSAPSTSKGATPHARGSSQLESHALSSKLRVTNPDRVIDASSGITKIELVRYYGLVGDLMMEHLKDRPVSLVRAPSGIGGQLFFQKHAETEKLPGIRQLDPALYITHPPMLEVDSKEGLLSAAQWNVVEIHTLNTSSKSFEHPDRIVFDLDPGEGVTWASIQEAATIMRVFLEQLGLPAFLKTSGGKGLHVVVPIKKVHDWDAAKGFSQAVVQHLAKTLPDKFVAKSGGKNRIGKIFIDYLRNGLGATTVCAWSARARPGLGISVPVEWGELPSLRGGDHWTIRTVQARLAQGNSPWQAYARASKTLSAAMKTVGYSP